MSRQRRAFSPEFKDEAVKLVLTTGRPAAQVGKEIGVAPATLNRWVKLHRDRVEADTPITESERAELKRLRREVRELELDRAFLKKASIFFAQEAADTPKRPTN